MEKFPIDCFKFFPCTHKLCNFCYNNIKELKCPYCRLDIELSSDDNDDYNYNPPNVINKKKKKKRNRNRNRTQSNNNISETFNIIN
tara:strand:+ start:1964 stop:2221 length:258 start_codon:yes stop_codon:yes gene_type:complete